jgi:small neutral amino acid transporter SnatA (MarC family)
MTKIMGFLTLCIGVQFLVNGILDPELIRRFHAPLPEH